MKIKSKEECKAIAQDIFNRYPKAQKLMVSSDGQAFIVDNGDAAAKNHSRNNRSGKELELHVFIRDNVEVAKKDKVEYAETAKNLIAQIKAAETTEIVQDILAAETATGAPRATVVKEAEAKLETLKNA